MTTTELGACEWFVWDLRRSNLIDRGQLDQLVCEFLKKNPAPEPPALAQFLVDQGSLTPFQAERLLQGKTQGLVLGPYVLTDSLGSGSMGTVYRGLSKNDNQYYAIKVLPRRSMWNVRIARRQVRAFEQCRHPAVVPFVDVGTAGGTHYLAWPLVEGETLENLVKRVGKLEPGVAAQYALQAAEGLDICHRQNLIHGLFKPSNIMIGPDGQVRILDLGIGSILANSEGESLVDTMSTANSLTSGLDCASPESIVEPTNRTPAGDQYSLGCVLYFCLTGQCPFPEGSAVEKMMAHQTKQPTPISQLNPSVPRELVAVVERLMEKKPEARYPRTGDVLSALQPFAGRASLAMGGPTPPPPTRAAVARAIPEAVPVKANPQARAARLPSTPAERPAATLVTREALKGGQRPVVKEAQTPRQTAPQIVPPATPGPQRAPTRTRPVRAPQREKKDAEERLGTFGLFLCAVMATCLTWLLSLWIFR
jgi:serine/threonine-protein kinase